MLVFFSSAQIFYNVGEVCYERCFAYYCNLFRWYGFVPCVYRCGLRKGASSPSAPQARIRNRRECTYRQIEPAPQAVNALKVAANWFLRNKNVDNFALPIESAALLWYNNK